MKASILSLFIATSASVAGATESLLPASAPRARPGTTVREDAAGWLDVTCNGTYGWPGVELRPKNGGTWDLSSVGVVEVVVSNLGENVELIAADVFPQGATTRDGLPYRCASVPPGTSRLISVQIADARVLTDVPVNLDGTKGIVGSASELQNYRETAQVEVFQVQQGNLHPIHFAVLDVRTRFEAADPVIVSATNFFPFCDRYGQFKHTEWPGKVHSDAELLAARDAEEAWLAAHAASPIPDADQYGGWAGGPKLTATGFFRTEKVDGKWWLVDPEGHLFFSLGVAAVYAWTQTRVNGRENYFEWIPATLAKSWRNDDQLADFLAVNLTRKYGGNFNAQFADTTQRRFHAWGINTIGNWSHEYIWALRRTPYVVTIDPSTTASVSSLNGVGGARAVNSPQFALDVRRQLQELAEKVRDDPWCIGVFIDNELPWTSDDVPDVAETYFSTIAAEVRAALPNHLYLGCRFMRFQADAWRAAARHCDVVSFNFYERHPTWDLPPDAVDKPIIVGEFHFGALDRGHLAGGCAMAFDQNERAQCFKDYVNACLDNPRYVGCHWFQYTDQAMTGRYFDGEAYQCGFVSVTDTPYSELVEACRETAATMYRRRIARAPNGGSADSTWVGPNCSTDPAAWNIATNWSGGVPAGFVKASIPYMLEKNYVLHFTPPLDFIGEIAGGRDSSDWDVKWPTYLKLTVLDGAIWTVGGNGHLIATEGIAGRLASTFSGTILIPPAMSFTAAPTLNANVEFVGKGTLTLTTTNQLSHISGFSGTLVWDGPDGASLTPVDMAVLQQHGIRLGDGASINLRDRFLAINGVHEIPDWNAAAADWSFNGSTNGFSVSQRFAFDAAPPHANEAGELELVNDAAQIHSVCYKGYKLKMHDSWGVSFHWKPSNEVPKKYADAGMHGEWSGMFGFYFVADPTECGTTIWQPGGRGQGFGVNFWSDSHGWQFNRSGIGVPLPSSAIAAIGDGVSFREEADVDVTCQNGTLTVTVTQGDKMFAVQRPTFNKPTNLGLVPDGYYIGFAASSDWWNDTNVGVPLSLHTISDFRGWYRAREAHGWQQVPDNVYPFTSANCTARIYTDESTYVENAAALESDGSFRLEPYGSRTRNILRANYSFDRTKKYLIQFDLVAGRGTDAENTEFTKMGFVKTADALSSWVFNYKRIGEEEWDGYAYPIMMTTSWYYKWTRFWADDKNRANRQHSQASSTPSMVKETTTHVGFLYDGRAGVYYQAHSGKHSMDMGWIPPEFIQNDWLTAFGYPVRFQISHANTWGQVDTVLKNFSIKRLDTPDTSYVGGEISVETNAVATLLADASAASLPVAAARVRKVSLAAGSELAVATDVSGSRVDIESVAISGADAQISSTAKTTIGGDLAFTGGIPSSAAVFSGDVTFDGGPAVLTVPKAWSKTRLIRMPLFTLASTTSGVLPSGYRVVTDEGEDVTEMANVIVHANSVSLSFGKGSTIMLR